MTRTVTVIGSGASAVHFALTLLRKGFAVTMLDRGRRGEPPPAPRLDFGELKAGLADPAGYFLGPSWRGALLPDADAEYYGIPPGKDYVFADPSEIPHAAQGFAPLFSFGQGGLAQAWTAGCYPFDGREVSAFGLPADALAPHYDEVARRIGVSGADDDLARFMPVHRHLQRPLRLDALSEHLLARYGRRREMLNTRLGAYLGRTRVATLSEPLDGRAACDYRGRCLWGCPHDALYTPSLTLAQCRAFPAFRYVGGVEVLHFETGTDGRIATVAMRRADGDATEHHPVEHVALAAGTLSSARILLRTLRRRGAGDVRLPGLMDNRQVLVPFIAPALLGRDHAVRSYQYHLLGLGLDAAHPRGYVHCQITTLKTALLHPIIQRLPLDLRTATFLMRFTHAALGVVNVNLPDWRRDGNFIALDSRDAADDPRLRIHYAPPDDEPRVLAGVLERVKRTLRALGCFVPPGMTHVRPMGASVHYAGILPMGSSRAPLTTDTRCRSHDFPNLHVIDGSTFPVLPAKNITFTLMANAVRVAEAEFGAC